MKFAAAIGRLRIMPRRTNEVLVEWMDKSCKGETNRVNVKHILADAEDITVGAILTACMNSRRYKARQGSSGMVGTYEEYEEGSDCKDYEEGSARGEYKKAEKSTKKAAPAENTKIAPEKSMKKVAAEKRTKKAAPEKSMKKVVPEKRTKKAAPEKSMKKNTKDKVRISAALKKLRFTHVCNYVRS